MQKNIDAYIKNCDPNISNESFIEMVQKSRNKLNGSKKKHQKKVAGADFIKNVESQGDRQGDIRK